MMPPKEIFPLYIEAFILIELLQFLILTDNLYSVVISYVQCL